MLKDKWCIFNDKKELFKSLSEEILYISDKCIKEKGVFSIVLAGGKSPMPLYKILSKSNSDWANWHVYIGDERCLPIGDYARNDTLIINNWLSGSDIPSGNIHLMRPELGMHKARTEYEKVIGKIDKFDVVLLGMGEDGHTASLFPNRTYPNNDVILEINSPKFPKERISMSYFRLNKARYVYKLVIGKSKEKVVDLWKKGAILPITSISGDLERIYVNNT